MNKDWQAEARARFDSAWHDGNALRLWDILRHPNNIVSRQRCKTHCPEAPTPRAAIKVWRTFLTTRFPDLESLIMERSAASDARIQAKQETWHRDRLHLRATLGPNWQHRGVIYPHALAFVEFLQGDGYLPEAVGIGTILFRKDGGWQVGPMRNKHINAAVAYLALPPQNAE